MPQLRARIVRELIESHGWSITSAVKAIGISSTAAAKYKRIIATSSGYYSISLDSFSRSFAERILKNELTPSSFIEEVCLKCI